MSSYNKEYYEFSKAHGFCVHCSKKAVEGKTCCEDCTKYNKDYVSSHYKENYEFSKAHGFCVLCNRKAIEGKTRCAYHTQDWKEKGYSQASRDRRKKRGDCVFCGNKARKGKVNCADCAKRDSAKQKKLRDFKKEHGICATYTCENKAREGKTQCEDCSKAGAKKYLEKKSLRKFEILSAFVVPKGMKAKKRELGICYYCENKARENRRTCSSCGEMRLNILRELNPRFHVTKRNLKKKVQVKKLPKVQVKKLPAVMPVHKVKLSVHQLERLKRFNII